MQNAIKAITEKIAHWSVDIVYLGRPVTTSPGNV